jgi:hypothetical protein
MSEVTAEHKQGLRIAVPERAEVVAVHGDDDWFELFADEKNLAPRTGRRREPIARQPVGPIRSELSRAPRRLLLRLPGPLR